MRISVEDDLRGRTVIDGDGRAIGLVDGVLVDSQSWRVEAFRVKLRREAAEEVGMAYRVFGGTALDLPITLVHAAGDAIILNVPTSALRDLVPAERAEHAAP
jgi:sporulation protein YlmC with PRC-barrel domain